MTGEPTLPPTGDPRDAGGLSGPIPAAVAASASAPAADVHRRLAFLVEASELLATSLDLAPAIRSVARLAASWLCDVCAVDVLAEGGVLERIAVACADPALEPVAEELRAHPADATAPALREVLELQRPVVLPTLSEADLEERLRGPGHRAMFDRLGIRSAMVLPLTARGATIGAMSLAGFAARPAFGPDDLPVAEELARRVAQAIDAAALLREATAAKRQARDLLLISDVALSHLDLDGLLATVLQRLESVLGGDTAGVLLTDDGERELVERASTRIDVRGGDWPRIPLGDGPIGALAVAGEPAAFDDLRGLDVRSGVIARQGVRSMLAAPLATAGRPVGVLYVGFAEPRRFPSEALELLGLAAGRIAVAVANARAFESEQRASARFTLLARAGEILGESFDVRGALADLAGVLVPALADQCTIALADDALPGASEPERRSVIEGSALGSVLVVPLTARGRTLGAITLVRAEGHGAFTVDDRWLAEEVARRAALALDMARVYRERDLVASTLQRSLLPPSLPSIPGLELAAVYHPAGSGAQVGGDFYDAFEVAERGWFVVVGDVCGKGVEAAALTGLVRHTVRAAALHEPMPSRVLAMVNRLLLAEVAENRFCTVAAARVDLTPAGATVRVACGGHPPPLALKPGREIEEACGPGTLLGVFDDPQLEDREVELGRGDVLVLYTDGVVEGRRDGEIFGEGRLHSLLAASRDLDAGGIADRVERAVLEFKPGAPDDDVAVVVLKPVGS
jgi:serine phosphatase RsbU (regulator of sigma subunit)